MPLLNFFLVSKVYTCNREIIHIEKNEKRRGQELQSQCLRIFSEDMLPAF